MSNIPSYLPVAQQPAGTAPSQAVIPAPPPGLTRLSAGTLIEGTVIGRTKQGLLAVKTGHGELALRTAASPPVQSRVVLQLQPSGGQFRVILLSVEAAQAAPGSAQKAATSNIGGQAGSQAPAPAVQARGAPAPAGSAPLAQAPPTAQSRTVPGTAPPAPPTAQAPVTPRPGAPPPGQAASGQPAGQALPAPARPAAPPATLSTPTVLTAQSSAPGPNPAGLPSTAPALPPGPASAAAPANPAAPTPPPGATPAAAPANLPAPAPSPGATPAATPANPTAPATAGAPTGTPTVATPAAALANTLGAVAQANPGISAANPAAAGGQVGQGPLPPGGPPAAPVSTSVSLPGAASLSSVNPAATGLAGTPPAGAAISAAFSGVDLIRNWPGLDQAMAALRAASPQLAATNIDAVVPRPGPQLAGSLALLIYALRGGDIRGWLGQSTMRELARSSGKEAAGRLADDFGQLSRLARADSGEWRVQALPFFDGSRHQQIQLYMKRRDQGGDGGEDAPARFVFEFDLSNLGPVQLDGLAANRRFDLVVRSQEDLPEIIRKEIGALFARSQEESGFAGEVHFQTVPAFAIAPLGDVQPDSDGLIV